MNYRKLRIGAGNRINAEVALQGGRGGVPTAQDAAVELQVLLVGSMPPSTGGFFPRTSGSDDGLQRRERSGHHAKEGRTHTRARTHTWPKASNVSVLFMALLVVLKAAGILNDVQRTCLEPVCEILERHMYPSSPPLLT